MKTKSQIQRALFSLAKEHQKLNEGRFRCILDKRMSHIQFFDSDMAHVKGKMDALTWMLDNKRKKL